MDVIHRPGRFDAALVHLEKDPPKILRDILTGVRSVLRHIRGQTPDSGLWDKEQAAQYLGVSVRSVDGYRADPSRPLPFITLPGGHIRFDPRLVRRWASKRSHG